MEFTVSLGDVLVSAAGAIVAWQASNVVIEIRQLARRCTDLEAWAMAGARQPFTPRAS